MVALRQTKSVIQGFKPTCNGCTVNISSVSVIFNLYEHLELACDEHMQHHIT